FVNAVGLFAVDDDIHWLAPFDPCAFEDVLVATVECGRETEFILAGKIGQPDLSEVRILVGTERQRRLRSIRAEVPDPFVRFTTFGKPSELLVGDELPFAE